MATDTKTSAPRRDLRALSRGGVGGDHPETLPALASALIPRPPLNWKTRVWLPAGILVGGLLLLTYVLGDALSAATDVEPAWDRIFLLS